VCFVVRNHVHFCHQQQDHHHHHLPRQQELFVRVVVLKCSESIPGRGGRVVIVHRSYVNNRSIITWSPPPAVVARRSGKDETAAVLEAARRSSSFATTSTVCFVFWYRDHRCHLHPDEGEGSYSVRVAAVRSSYCWAWSRYCFYSSCLPYNCRACGGGKILVLPGMITVRTVVPSSITGHFTHIAVTTSGVRWCFDSMAADYDVSSRPSSLQQQ